MSSDVGFIGIGAAGNNIVDELSRLGMHTAALNFSSRDLEALEHTINTFKIIGHEGVGHSRETAISLISNHYDAPVNFIKQNFASTNVLFFIFSTGGGTGSGSSPILADLIRAEFPDKAIVCVPVMPDLSESSTSLLNTLKVFEELSDLDVCILPVDNQMIRSNSEAMGKSKLYGITNKLVADLLYRLHSYTEKSSKNGNFDKLDFLNLFRQRGLATIGEILDVEDYLQSEELSLSTKSMKHLIKQSIKSSVFAPIEFNRIQKAAIIIDSKKDEIIDHVNSSIFDDFKNEPHDIYESINHDESGYILTVYTGLSWCKTRLTQIEDVLAKRQEELKNNEPEEDEVFKSKFVSMSISSSRQGSNEGKRSPKDILSKYKKR